MRILQDFKELSFQSYIYFFSCAMFQPTTKASNYQYCMLNQTSGIHHDTRLTATRGPGVTKSDVCHIKNHLTK